MAKLQTPNVPIGTCPCPFRGCDEIGTLHKYRQQAESQKRVVRAGKLYMRCATHGMIQDQEWLLENGTIGENAPAASAAPEIEPVKSPTSDDQAEAEAEVLPETPEIEAEPVAEPGGIFAEDKELGF